MGFIKETPQFRFPNFDGSEFFTPEEMEIVTVLFEALIPADHSNGVPGASDAGAAIFLTQLLALSESNYYKIPEWRKEYRNGLKFLNEVANTMYESGISDLTQIQVHEFLKNMEDGKLKGLPEEFNQGSFFKMLLEHCIKGCYSDPRWGGNRDTIMWRWLGWIQPAEDIQFKFNKNGENV